MNNSPIIGVNFETKARHKTKRRKCLYFNKKFNKMNFGTSQLTRTRIALILLLTSQ
jgi:hypothetical protein